VSSVGKRRRERIQAKRNAERLAKSDGIPYEEALEQAAKKHKPRQVETDEHAVAAPGRKARRQRRQARQQAPKEDDGATEYGLAAIAENEAKPKRLTLGQRRQMRRRERLRRKGIAPDRPEVRVRPKGVVWVSWRWLSGMLTLTLIVTLYAMLNANVFMVDSIAVGEVRYLTRAQVFENADVFEKNLFQIDPTEVEERLESNPSIADAQVFIGWPPNMVSISVIERDPALIWEQAGFEVWVDINGIVMFPRQERQDLVRVVNQSETVPILGAGSRLDREHIAGALQLQQQFPTIDVLLYDDIKGLGYRDGGPGRNWIVWFGTGTNMDLKVAMYETIVQQNFPNIQFSEIDVSDPDYPTYVIRR
jgi:cell division septal protein FtsQ